MLLDGKKLSYSEFVPKTCFHTVFSISNVFITNDNAGKVTIRNAYRYQSGKKNDRLLNC